MIHRPSFYAAAWVGLILLTGLCSAEPPEFSAAEGSAENYPVTDKHFLIARSIFQAIEKQDLDWVVARMAYPTKVIIPGKKPKLVSSPDDLRKILEAQFRVGLGRRMLAEIRADPELFSNYQGVMMGRGTVWFVGNGTEVGKMFILSFGVAYQPQ